LTADEKTKGSGPNGKKVLQSKFSFMYSPPQIIKPYISFRPLLIKRVELSRDVVTFLHSTKEQSIENV
jgi:hypothetical protein